MLGVLLPAILGIIFKFTSRRNLGWVGNYDVIMLWAFLKYTIA